MRLSRRSPRELTGLNMTAMIDIVFLLLIFFMTVSQITQNMAAEVRLPAVGWSEDALLPAPLEIVVRRDGVLFVGGEETALEGIGVAVVRAAQEGGSSPSRIDVQLRVDEACDSGQVNAVLRRLSMAGIRRVWSAVMPERPSGETP